MELQARSFSEGAHNSGIGRAVQRSTIPGFFSPVAIRAKYVTAHRIEAIRTRTQGTSVVTHPKNSTMGSRTMKWVTRKLFQSGPANKCFVLHARKGGCRPGVHREKQATSSKLAKCRRQSANIPMVSLFPSKKTCFEELGMLAIASRVLQTTRTSVDGSKHNVYGSAWSLETNTGCPSNHRKGPSCVIGTCKLLCASVGSQCPHTRAHDDQPLRCEGSR